MSEEKKDEKAPEGPANPMVSHLPKREEEKPAEGPEQGAAAPAPQEGTPAAEAPAETSPPATPGQAPAAAPAGEGQARPPRPAGPGGERRPPREAPRRRRFPRRKVCFFRASKAEYIDYKDVTTLRRFVSENGKILPRRMTGTSAKFQRLLTTAVKRARYMGLLPFSARHR